MRDSCGESSIIGHMGRITEGLIQTAWEIYYEDEPAWKDLVIEDDDANIQEMLDVVRIGESALFAGQHQ
jgi:hypothetical protein